MIVADTNMVVYLFVESEFTQRARHIHALDPDWAFPPIVRSEAANALATLAREKWITPQTASEALKHIEKRIAAGFRDVSMGSALKLAMEKRLSAHDAQFIVLARLMGVNLVTEDGQLRSKFPDVALSMKAFIERCKDRTVREARAVYGAQRKRQHKSLLKRP